MAFKSLWTSRLIELISRITVTNQVLPRIYDVTIITWTTVTLQCIVLFECPFTLAATSFNPTPFGRCLLLCGAEGFSSNAGKPVPHATLHQTIVVLNSLLLRICHYRNPISIYFPFVVNQSRCDRRFWKFFGYIFNPHSAKKYIFFMVQQPPVCQGLLIIEASWSHSDTPHSVGLLWTSDQPDAETCAW
jgi:hypothetical protein